MTELYIRTGNELIAIQDLHVYFMNNVRSNFTILACGRRCLAVLNKFHKIQQNEIERIRDTVLIKHLHM